MISPLHRTLLFQRKESLFALPLPPLGALSTRLSRPRLLAKIEGLTFDGYNSVWHVNRSGSHIVYRRYLKDYGSLAEPSAVHVALLPGLREDRILFLMKRSLEPAGDAATIGPYSLRAANGAAVEKLSEAADGEVDATEGWEDESLGNRDVDGLRWSSRGTEIYVSLKRVMPMDMPVSTTCVVHMGPQCFADTNRRGEWHRRLTARITDEHNGLLIGAGNGRTKDSADVCNACSRYEPIYVAERSHLNASRSLLPETFDSKHVPQYGYSGFPALAPDGQIIAFATYCNEYGKTAREGIWLVDRHTRQYRRFLHTLNVRQIGWESPQQPAFSPQRQYCHGHACQPVSRDV